VQLINTAVANTTEGTVTVEFHGEGNEMISVRMAADNAHGKQESIMRAREMMVQIAALGDDGHPSGVVEGEGVSIKAALAAESDQPF
jgi:hypothetical protein